MEGSTLFVDQVRTELDQLGSGKGNPVKNLLTLAVTLAVFFSVGLFRDSLQGIVAIVVVLLVHEAGHLVGMKLYGYRDVQMFFIPFFGAAVSGVDNEPRAARQAVVSLLGPVPGILIGVVLGGLYMKSGNPLYKLGSNTFLFINGFNLLPFYPLDGGRFLNAILFSRSIRLEAVAQVIAGLVLIAGAFILHTYLLGVFAVFVLLGLRTSRVVARTACDIQDLGTSASTPDKPGSPEFLAVATTELRSRLKVKTDDPKFIAEMVRDVWQRVSRVPASWRATLGLVAFYLAMGLVVTISPAVFMASEISADLITKIEDITNEAGEDVVWQVQYYKDTRTSEVPVDADGFYHGLQTTWDYIGGELRRKGNWEHGWWQGRWETYESGVLQSVVEYEKGQPVRYAKDANGSLRWVPRQEWPMLVKMTKQKARQKAW